MIFFHVNDYFHTARKGFNLGRTIIFHGRKQVKILRSRHGELFQGYFGFQVVLLSFTGFEMRDWL
jgi:hypothetical protein